MSTLAFIGLFSPARALVILFILGIPILAVVGLVMLIARLSGSSRPTIDPRDADLDRRRRTLELERMELENQERRARLSGMQPPPVPPR